MEHESLLSAKRGKALAMLEQQHAEQAAEVHRLTKVQHCDHLER